MPGRKIPLVSQEYYHIFNRGIDRHPTFTTKREYQRALNSLKFYHYTHPPVSLSKFLNFKVERQQEILKHLQAQQKLVRVISFTLMPNHFHLLAQQISDKGISKYLSNFQNSYTKYFNTRHERDGPLFLDQFKAVLIETDEQLLHVSRYIHLNCYSGHVVKTLADLEHYPWSSFLSYLEAEDSFVDITEIMNHFSSIEKYRRFVFDQADYRRRLKEIEHLLFE